MISCSGLPLCLSGIHILPQNRQYASEELRRSRTVDSVNSPSSQDLRSPPVSSSLHRSETMSDTGNLSSDRESSASFSSEDVLERRSSGISRRSTPRLSVVQEMADLDCRREEIRQRFRSLLLSRDDIGMFRYRTSPHLMERFLNNCIAKHLIRLREDRSESTQISVCAKAA